jgi:hypothetical protein
MADTRCEAVRLELAEVRRGRATPEIAERVHSHLARCADCRAEADWDARLADVLASPAAGVDVEARVRRLLRRRQTLRRCAVGMAAAAVIGVAGLAIFDLPGRPSRPAAPPSETVVMKELAGVVSASPVVRLDADRQQELLLAELTRLTGDKP